jgi:hypothetical protein
MLEFVYAMRQFFGTFVDRFAQRIEDLKGSWGRPCGVTPGS